MKITFFLPEVDDGGGARVILNQISGMCGVGQTVSVITLDPGVKQRVPAQVKVKLVAERDGRPLPARGLGAAARTIKVVARFLRELQPDAFVVIWKSNLAMLAWSLSRCDGVFVLEAQTNLSVIWKLQRFWARAPHRLAAWCTYRLADVVVSPSAGLAAALTKELSLARGAIKNIPNPAVEFGPTEADRTAALMSDGRPRFLAAGRLAAQKDFGTLIRAFALLRKHREASLYILGDGPKRDELRALIEHHGLEGDIRMPGYQTNLPEWIRNAACVVSSSVHEGFPNLLLESLLLGAQVVATDCPFGPAEILDDGRYGFLAPVGDHEALAAQMEEALRSPIPRERLVARAREFSLENVTAQYLRMIDDAVRGSANRRALASAV